MRAALYILFVLFASQQLLAQEAQIPDNPLFPNPRPKRIFIGPIVGYNSNFHTGDFQTLGNAAYATSADCGSFTTGGGNGFLAGLAAEYWFKPGGATALQVRVYYEQKPGNFDNTGAPLTYFDTVTATPIQFSRNYHVQAKYNLINLEITYKYDIPGLPHFGVEIGPKFGFLMSSQYYQYQDIPTPGFVFQATGTNKQDLVPAQNIPQASSFRFGLKGGLQYEALLGPVLVTPAIWYDLGVTKVVNSWGVNSLAGSIEFKYGF
ncbi:MAG TPA: outer membrane beta-barrel protein [Candidatus Kapabacteria bacterium]|nr:outer membrane beta-barrel protein [Candidatus Kapabacteria bacterium]